MTLSRKTDPKTGKHTLCELAQAKRTWTFQKSHFVEIYRKNAMDHYHPRSPSNPYLQWQNPMVIPSYCPNWKIGAKYYIFFLNGKLPFVSNLQW